MRIREIATPSAEGYVPRFPGRGALASRLSAATLALVLFTGCAVTGPDRYGSAALEARSSVLREARDTTRSEGLPRARDLVAKRLAERDFSRGELERRVIATTRDPGFAWPDSLAALPREERRRIAVVLVPGTRTGFGGPSMTRQTLRDAARKSEAMGFDTHFLDTPPRGGVQENAALVAEAVAPVFEEADRVVMLALSKGAHDLVHYLQEHALELPVAQRAKLRLVLTLGGTLQGSVVADFFANSPRLVPVVLRSGLVLRGKREQIGMLKTIARSPWRPEDASRMAEGFPNLTWVSLAMVPDGEDGRIAERLWSPPIRKRISRFSPYFSPADGLVESAASVLPDGVEVPEWIVRGFGSHAIPNARYADGSPVAPRTKVPGDETLNPASGGEIMDAYLRALPRSLVGIQ